MSEGNTENQEGRGEMSELTMAEFFGNYPAESTVFNY
jgi:hypothetical protein